MIVQNVITAGRTVSAFPRLCLLGLLLFAGIYTGCIGPEDYPPECESDHIGHIAFIADNPDVCP